MSQIRVLHCNNDNKNMGGAYLVTRKLDPYMRKYGVVFDYITMDGFVTRGDPETDPLPDTRTFSAGLRKNRWIGHFRFWFYVRNVMRENPYPLVHIDIDSAWKALFYAVPAKKNGAKVIVHSHATGIDGDGKGIKGTLHRVCRNVLSKYADRYIGCSREALRWLCPEEQLASGEVLINGIDGQEFYFDPELREKTRMKLGISDRFVLCNVGRINANKNQGFLVDVLKKLKEKIPSAFLILVGPREEGYYDALCEKIHSLGLEQDVLFAGETDRVNRYLNAADVFVLPSVFEGFSLASIEAQRTGLPCLLSDGVPAEVLVTSSARQEPLAGGAETWAGILSEMRACSSDRKTVELGEAYTLSGMAGRLLGIYKGLNVADER